MCTPSSWESNDTRPIVRERGRHLSHAASCTMRRGDAREWPCCFARGALSRWKKSQFLIGSASQCPPASSGDSHRLFAHLSAPPLIPSLHPCSSGADLSCDRLLPGPSRRGNSKQGAKSTSSRIKGVCVPRCTPWAPAAPDCQVGTNDSEIEAESHLAGRVRALILQRSPSGPVSLRLKFHLSFLKPRGAFAWLPPTTPTFTPPGGDPHPLLPHCCTNAHLEAWPQ